MGEGKYKEWQQDQFKEKYFEELYGCGFNITQGGSSLQEV